MRNRHHRRPQSLGGTAGRYHDQKFIVWVDERKHEAWHRLFGNMTPEEVFDEINNRWLDPRYRIGLERI